MYISIAAFRVTELFEGQHPLTMWIEFSFVVNVFISFLTDFIVEGESKPTRDFNLIANRYVKGEFKFDIIALIPF